MKLKVGYGFGVLSGFIVYVFSFFGMVVNFFGIMDFSIIV